MTSDHGVPFPRAKGTLYDAGTHVGLAIRAGRDVSSRWAARAPAGTVSRAVVSTLDLAPTIFEAAGLPAPDDWDGESLLPLLQGAAAPPGRRRGEYVLTGLEKANYENNHTGYPMRAMRTARHLYIRNFEPAREPPQYGPYFYGASGDYVGSAAESTKAAGRRFYRLCFGRRPPEELYDVERDPEQLVNLAPRAEHAHDRARLSSALAAALVASDDPRMRGDGAAVFERPLDWLKARTRINMRLSAQGKPQLTFTGARPGGHLPRPDELPTWIVEPKLPKPSKPSTPSKSSKPSKPSKSSKPSEPQDLPDGETVEARAPPALAAAPALDAPATIQAAALARAESTTSAAVGATRHGPMAASLDDSGERYCVGDTRCAVVGGTKRCWKSRQCQRAQG